MEQRGWGWLKEGLSSGEIRRLHVLTPGRDLERNSGTATVKPRSVSDWLFNVPVRIEGKKVDPRRTAVAPDDKPGEGEEEIEGGTFGGEGGSGANGGGGGEGKGGAGKRGGEQPRPTIPIRYRTFATDAGVYVMTVQSEERFGEVRDSKRVDCWR